MVFLPHHEIFTMTVFFQNQFTAVLAKRGSPKAMTGTNM